MTCLRDTFGVFVPTKAARQRLATKQRVPTSCGESPGDQNPESKALLSLVPKGRFLCQTLVRRGISITDSTMHISCFVSLHDPWRAMCSLKKVGLNVYTMTALIFGKVRNLATIIGPGSHQVRRGRALSAASTPKALESTFGLPPCTQIPSCGVTRACRR